MDAFTTLMDTYSLEGILFFLVALVVAVKTIGKSVEWIWEKFKKQFNVKTDSDRLEEIAVRLDSVDTKIATRLDTVDESIKSINTRLAGVKEQLLQDAKAYIIDQHHYYCYKMKCIDDMSLQLLEIRFSFYVSSGGNSYVESLMAEIRALPRVSAENIKMVQKEV